MDESTYQCRCDSMEFIKSFPKVEPIRFNLSAQCNIKEMQKAMAATDQIYYQHSFEKMQLTLGISPAGALKRIKMGLDPLIARPQSLRKRYPANSSSDVSSIYNNASADSKNNQNKTHATRLQRFIVKPRDKNFIQVNPLTEDNNGNEGDRLRTQHSTFPKVQKLINRYSKNGALGNNTGWVYDSYEPISNSEVSEGNGVDFQLQMKRLPRRQLRWRPSSVQGADNFHCKQRQRNYSFSPQSNSRLSEHFSPVPTLSKNRISIPVSSANSVSSISELKKNEAAVKTCSCFEIASIQGRAEQAPLSNTLNPLVGSVQPNKQRQSAYIEPNAKSSWSGKKAHLAILMHPSTVPCSNGIRMYNATKNSSKHLNYDDDNMSTISSSSQSTECNTSITSSTYASDDLNQAIFDMDYADENGMNDLIQNVLDVQAINDNADDDDELTIPMANGAYDAFEPEPSSGSFTSSFPIAIKKEQSSQQNGFLQEEITVSTMPNMSHGDDEHAKLAMIMEEETLQMKSSSGLENKIHEVEIEVCRSFDEAGDTGCSLITAIVLDVPFTEMKKDVSLYPLGTTFPGLAHAISEPLARMQNIFIAVLKEKETVYFDEAGNYCSNSFDTKLTTCKARLITIGANLKRSSLHAVSFGMADKIAQRLTDLPSLEEITAEDFSLSDTEEEMMIDNYFTVTDGEPELANRTANILLSYNICSTEVLAFLKVLTVCEVRPLLTSPFQRPAMPLKTTPKFKRISIVGLAATSRRDQGTDMESKPVVVHAQAECHVNGSHMAGSIAEIRGKQAFYRKIPKNHDSVLQRTFVPDSRPIITFSLTSSNASGQQVLRQKVSESLEVLTNACMPMSPVRFEKGYQYCISDCHSPIDEFY